MDAEFDELKREFLVEAEEKVREMESALTTPASTEALDRIIYLAHQLKGAGGSYGFQEISEEAALLEDILETSGASAAEAGVRDKIRKLAEEINSRARELAHS